jgi:Fic family protein
MANSRLLTLTAALTVAACANVQAPVAPGSQDHSAHHAAGAAAAAPTDRMAMMDAHMKAMREMHEKMSRARTPQERDALMADHMKLMREGMAMMGGMGMGGHGGMGPTGAASAPMDMGMRHRMMEKRMEMMQSMMQMMMDRMPTVPAPK